MLDYGLSTPINMPAGANDYSASNMEMGRYSNFNSFVPSPAQVGPNSFFNNVMFLDVSPMVATTGYEYRHPMSTLPFPLFSSPAPADQQPTYGYYHSPSGTSLTVSNLILYAPDFGMTLISKFLQYPAVANTPQLSFGDEPCKLELPSDEEIARFLELNPYTGPIPDFGTTESQPIWSSS
jgi:hypothetical protein